MRDAPPFTITGVDFSGALYVQDGNQERKVYICLYTCATTRAIHLEIVHDLTVDMFILSFRRFVSRRSLPSIMVSDNASTYQSASEELQSLLRSTSLTHNLSKQGVQWRFIPKRAPWYGGWWERLIGLTKLTIKKVLGRTHVSLVTLQTLITEVEAVLNDRPLTYMTSDIVDADPITPSHLLCGRRITPLPYVTVEDSEIEDPTYGSGVQVRAKKQALLLQHFQRRWREEYLTSLREFHQATGNNKQSIKVGDVVLVHDDTPRASWKMAVIEELIKGNDGLVRAAKIRTATGRTNRPIARLVPLEVASSTAPDTSQPPPQTGTEAPVAVTESGQPKPDTTTMERPRREAAQRGRKRMAEWIQELRAPPEDVMD